MIIYNQGKGNKTKFKEVTKVKNSKLQNLFKLSSKVTVIVPATININEEIDNTPYVDRVASLLSDCFGGATATTTLGYWKSPTMGLVKEKSTTVFAYCSESDLQNNIDKVIEFMRIAQNRNDARCYCLRNKRRNVFL